MAHFAKLDDNNIVLEVNVVANEALDPLNEEESGIAFLTEWSGGYSNWKQTSYNGTMRKNYAGVGFKYDEERDAFIPPKLYESFIFNEELCRWEPPIPQPEGDKWIWNEESGEWING